MALRLRGANVRTSRCFSLLSLIIPSYTVVRAAAGAARPPKLFLVHAHLHAEGHLWPCDKCAEGRLGGTLGTRGPRLFFILPLKTLGSNALSERIFTPSFHPERVHRPDRTMFYSFALFVILCSWTIASPLSLLRGSEPDGLTEVEPDHAGWFAHGDGDGLLGNLGDVLSGSLLDAMSGKSSPGLVRGWSGTQRLNSTCSQVTLFTPIAALP